MFKITFFFLAAFLLLASASARHFSILAAANSYAPCATSSRACLTRTTAASCGESTDCVWCPTVNGDSSTSICTRINKDTDGCADHVVGNYFSYSGKMTCPAFGRNTNSSNSDLFAVSDDCSKKLSSFIQMQNSISSCGMLTNLLVTNTTMSSQIVFKNNLNDTENTMFCKNSCAYRFLSALNDVNMACALPTMPATNISTVPELAWYRNICQMNSDSKQCGIALPTVSSLAMAIAKDPFAPAPSTLSPRALRTSEYREDGYTQPFVYRKRQSRRSHRFLSLAVPQGGCMPPKFYLNDTDCLVCGANNQSTKVNDTQCVSCPANSTRPQDSSDFCSCVQNFKKVGDNNYNFTCDQCPANTYTSDNKTACEPCPSNSFRNLGQAFCSCKPNYFLTGGSGNKIVCEPAGAAPSVQPGPTSSNSTLVNNSALCETLVASRKALGCCWADAIFDISNTTFNLDTLLSICKISIVPNDTCMASASLGSLSDVSFQLKLSPVPGNFDAFSMPLSWDLATTLGIDVGRISGLTVSKPAQVSRFSALQNAALVKFNILGDASGVANLNALQTSISNWKSLPPTLSNLLQNLGSAYTASVDAQSVNSGNVVGPNGPTPTPTPSNSSIPTPVTPTPAGNNSASPTPGSSSTLLFSSVILAFSLFVINMVF